MLLKMFALADALVDPDNARLFLRPKYKRGIEFLLWQQLPKYGPLVLLRLGSKKNI